LTLKDKILKEFHNKSTQYGILGCIITSPILLSMLYYEVQFVMLQLEAFQKYTLLEDNDPVIAVSVLLGIFGLFYFIINVPLLIGNYITRKIWNWRMKHWT